MKSTTEYNCSASKDCNKIKTTSAATTNGKPDRRNSIDVLAQVAIWLCFIYFFIAIVGLIRLILV
jgi:hypothetical protein